MSNPELAARIDAAYDLIFGRQLDEAAALLAEAEAQARALSDHRQLIRAIYWLAYIATLGGEHFHAEQQLGAALALAKAEAAPALIAGIHFSLARIHHMRGQLRDAEDALGLSLMHANNSGDKRREADAYALLAIVRMNQGLLEDAWEYCEAACLLFKQLPQEEHAATETLLDLSSIAFELGRDTESEAIFTEAMGLDSSQVHARLMSRGYLQRGLQALLLGETELAGQRLAEAEALGGAVLDYETQLDIELARGRYRHALGDYAQAAEHCINATRIAQNTQSRFRLAEVRLARSRTLMALGQSEKALAVLSDAEVAFEMFGAQQLLAQTCCVLARFRQAEGRVVAAGVAIQRARSIIAAMKQPVGRTLAQELALAEQESA